MRIFVIVLAIFLFISLLVMMAVALGRLRQQSEIDGKDDGEWEFIEPAQLDDGTPVSAEMSRRKKAQQVLDGRVYHDTQQQQRAGMRIGLIFLGLIVLLAALLLVPAFFVMFGP